MKNYTFLAILLLLALFCFTNDVNGLVASLDDDQDEPKINQVDDNGKKQGKWVFLGKDQPEKGYPDDGKISEGTFKDSRKNGLWIMYFRDGITPKTEGEFVNNRPNGSFTKYHANGNIKERGTFSKRRYIDTLTRYNEDGVKVYEAKYNDSGKESGKVTHYHDNGKPEFEYHSENGIPTGKATRYWPNGDVKEEIVYNEDGTIEKTSGTIDPVNPLEEESGEPSGKPAPEPKGAIVDFEKNGYNKIFNENKEIWMEGDFKNGLLWDGRLYIYDEDGLLEKVEVYKKGVYHSDGQI